MLNHVEIQGLKNIVMKNYWTTAIIASNQDSTHFGMAMETH